MPYYVVAIHTDSEENRLMDIFDNFHEARKFEDEMNAARIPEDNYFVRLIYADDISQYRKKVADLRT